MKQACRFLLAALPFWSATMAHAQDRITVPLTDAARPAVVRAGVINGSITVRAYSGKEVIVEARLRQREDSEERRGGMRRINIGTTGLEVQEENNTVRVDASTHSRPVDLDIQVPVRTSVKLSTINDGNLVVEGVNGEIEVSNTNGNVTLNKVAGSAVAHALNGRVMATFTQVDPQKPMSFSSLNGRIDVTFPPELKANVKMKSDHGDVFSDFDITLKPSPQPVTETGRDAKGQYRVRIDKVVYGTINGGGPEIQFSNLNGPIYIRKTGAPRVDEDDEDKDKDKPRGKRK